MEGLLRLMDGEHVGPFNLGNPGEFTMLELAEVSVGHRELGFALEVFSPLSPSFICFLPGSICGKYFLSTNCISLYYACWLNHLIISYHPGHMSTLIAVMIAVFMKEKGS